MSSPRIKPVVMLLAVFGISAAVQADNSSQLGLDATVLPAGSYGKVFKVTSVDPSGKAGTASLPANVLITQVRGVVGSSEINHTIVSVADMDSFAAGKDAINLKYVEITADAAGKTWETYLGLMTGNERIKRVQLKAASSSTTRPGSTTTTTEAVDTARKHSSYLGLTANEVMTTKYKKVLNVSDLDTGGAAATRATPALPKKFLIVGAVTVVDTQPFNLDQFSVTALNRLAAGRDSVRLEYVDITSFDPFAQNQEDFLRTALKKSSTVQLRGGPTPVIPPVTGPVQVTIQNNNPLKIYAIAKNYQGQRRALFPTGGVLSGEIKVQSIDPGTVLNVLPADNQGVNPINHLKLFTVPNSRTFSIIIQRGDLGVYSASNPRLADLLATWSTGLPGGSSYQFTVISGQTKCIQTQPSVLSSSPRIFDFNYVPSTGQLRLDLDNDGVEELYNVQISGRQLTLSDSSGRVRQTLRR